MYEYVPDRLAPGAPLVVALHGCTQSAESFDDESGWTAIADRLGFALLLPQQRAENNEDLCFNFFSEEDARRGAGEAASIMAMVEWMLSRHSLDPDRVFATGLSAGGGMAAVLLAAYPEAFAAGAIIAGLPVGCASTRGSLYLAWQKRWMLWTSPYGEAGWAAWRCGISRFGWLRPPATRRSAGEWRKLAEAAGPGPAEVYPRISLWQGSADDTVDPQNLEELMKQWTALHGIDAEPDRENAMPGLSYRAYSNDRGQIAVEAYDLTGMGHAVPIDPGEGPGRCGIAADDHFADRDICAAARIAAFWGLGEG